MLIKQILLASSLGSAIMCFKWILSVYHFENSFSYYPHFFKELGWVRGYPRISRDDLNISKRHSKYFHRCLQCSIFHNQRFWGIYNQLPWVWKNFVSFILYQLYVVFYIFPKFVSLDCDCKNLSANHETLVSRCKLGRDWSFQ